MLAEQYPFHPPRYADGDKVALNVGFYYMANALGRLTGVGERGAQPSTRCAGEAEMCVFAWK